MRLRVGLQEPMRLSHRRKRSAIRLPVIADERRLSDPA
jgi:hypothetical protein